MSAPRPDKFAGVREALRQDSPLWHIEHLDITCDGCDTEPIVRQRFKCTVCEDIDLCGSCMRALVAARIKMSQEAAPLSSAPARQGSRPRRWVSKLYSRDLSQRWAALMRAVPCLHPTHKFQKVLEGPERAVVFLAGRQQGQQQQTASSSSEQQQQAASSSSEQQQQEGIPAAAAGAGAAGNGNGIGTGCAAPNGTSGLEQFLATFPPSAASCRDVAWIVVAHPEGAEQQQQQAQQQQQQPGEQQKDDAGGAGSRGGGGGGGDSNSGSGSLEERVDAAVEEWEGLVAAAAKTGQRVTAADVDALAAKHGILKGKWMLFARSAAEADAAWAAVACAVCGELEQPGSLQAQKKEQQAAERQEEALAQQPHEQPGVQIERQLERLQVNTQQPQQEAEQQQQGQAQQQQWRRRPLCGSAKISSTGPAADGSWVLLCYTPNYQDAADVQRVCEGLQAALPHGLLQDRRLRYKPDIYTHLGIYSGNEWRLKPTTLEARLP